MKTYQQLLMLLPEPLGEMAVQKMEKQGDDPNDKAMYGISPLHSAFVWDQSEEGSFFWDAVYMDAIHHKLW